MSDPLIRLAGRTLGLLPVLQPRLLSMFAAEGAVEGEGQSLHSASHSASLPVHLGMNSEAHSESPLKRTEEFGDGDSTQDTGDLRLMPPSSPGRGIEGEGESWAMTDRSTLPLTRWPRSVMTLVDPIGPLASPPGTGIPLTPLGRGDRRGGDLEGDLEPRIESSVESRIEPRIESSVEPTREVIVQRSPALPASTDRPAPSVSTFVNPLVPPDRSILPLTRLPRSLMSAIVETRFAPITEPITEPIIEPFTEQVAEQVAEPWRTAPQPPILGEPNPRNRLQSPPELGDLGGENVGNEVNSPERSMSRDDRSPQSLESQLELLTDSIPIAPTPSERLIRDIVGEAIGIVQPNPIINSNTNHQTLSKQFEREIINPPQSISNEIINPLQSVSTDLRYEPRNSFRGGPETQQTTSLNSENFTPQPSANNTLDDRSQDLEFVIAQNSSLFSSNPSESLIPKNPDNRPQQALEVELRITATPIAQPTLETLIRDTVGESIGIVQPNPTTQSQNPSPNPEQKIAPIAKILNEAQDQLLEAPQSVSTDLRYEPRNSFRGGPETQQTNSDVPLPSPPPLNPLKVPLPKGDLGGSSPQTTIAITIGRISIRGVPPAAPPPSRSTRSNRPQVSLNDYLKSRNGGNG
jgi:hypothetical protein